MQKGWITCRSVKFSPTEKVWVIHETITNNWVDVIDRNHVSFHKDGPGMGFYDGTYAQALCHLLKNKFAYMNFVAHQVEAKVLEAHW